MPAPNRILQLEDLRSARTPEAIKTIFSKLGYTVQPRLTPVPNESVGFNPADTVNIRTLYLIASQGNPNRETALQIYLMEVDQTGMTRLRSLARNLIDRGINVLLVASSDQGNYRFLHFVHPRRDGNKVRIRKLVLDTTRPTRHDLDIIDGLAVQGRDPVALYAQHQRTFDIEQVTKKFYLEYAERFKRVAEAIAANNRGVRAFNDEDKLHGFTQRLLGRLMFLYFLQKKGWLAGDPQFLTNQYHRAVADEHLYFGTVLTPLFFDVLNRRRPNDESTFGNIPYLNGGLFDQTTIEKDNLVLYLPNSLFDPVQDGILSFFNLYNFTVTEETPIEQEVAVDPEMLGKVFENMMEVRERQSFGTFYTHRAIVQYMCREALVDFLSREASISIERLNALFESDEEEQKPDLTVREARAIEGALDHVRILDPAVGTGAFLVGALQEMIALRRICQRAMGNQVSRGGAVIAQWKRELIAHTLYGVDLKPEAVEIAKLRLWLSLVVDLERDQLEPLPNLTYKLRVGNSLLETIEGEPILPDLPQGDVPVAPFQGMLEGTGGGVQMGFDMDEATKEARTRLAEHKEQYFVATDKAKKERLRQRIENEERQVVLNALKVKIGDLQLQIDRKSQHGSLVNWQGKKTEKKEIGNLTLKLGKLSDVYTAIQRGDPLPFFLYRLHFFEVFRERGGFDIVLANPPYVRQELITDQKHALKVAFPEVYHGVADLFVYFYARALNLLRDGGLFAFISSNKFMRSNYGQGLRGYLTSAATILSVIDFGDTPIFDAITYPAIVIARKYAPKATHQPRALNVRDMETVGQLAIAVQKRAFALDSTALTPSAWTLEESKVLALMKKLRDVGKPLGDVVQGRFYYGIKSGYQDAFVIDEATRTALIAADPRSDEIIKPYLRGRDIKRWRTEWAGKYLIFARRGINIEQYPALLSHLSHFRERLTPGVKGGRKAGTYKWYELQDAIDYYLEFEQSKIISARFMIEPLFGWDEIGAYTNDACYIFPGNKYILALLNSKVHWYFLNKIATYMQNQYLQIHIQYLGQLPIPEVTPTERASIEQLVGQILEARGIGAEVKDLEGEINERVYRLFGLSREEVSLIENSA